MSVPTTEYQLNEPQLLVQVARLATELRMMCTQLQMEEQQTLVGNNSSKRLLIQQALREKKQGGILTQLDAIGKGERQWIPSATRTKDDVLDAIGEVINDASKLGQDWQDLLQSLGVNSPVNPLFNR